MVSSTEMAEMIALIVEMDRKVSGFTETLDKVDNDSGVYHRSNYNSQLIWSDEN